MLGSLSEKVWRLFQSHGMVSLYIEKIICTSTSLQLLLAQVKGPVALAEEAVGAFAELQSIAVHS